MDKEVRWICRECKGDKFIIKYTKHTGKAIIICSNCSAEHTLKPDGRLYIIGGKK